MSECVMMFRWLMNILQQLHLFLGLHLGSCSHLWFVFTIRDTIGHGVMWGDVMKNSSCDSH